MKQTGTEETAFETSRKAGCAEVATIGPFVILRRHDIPGQYLLFNSVHDKSPLWIDLDRMKILVALLEADTKIVKALESPLSSGEKINKDSTVQ